VIVSLPAVAVNVTPANGCVGSVAAFGKFSTALADATNGIEDATVNPKSMGGTGSMPAKGGAKSAAKSASSSVETTPDTREAAARLVPNTSGNIFNTPSFLVFAPLVSESAISKVSETISSSTPVENLKPVITSSAEVASPLPSAPAGPSSASLPPQLSKATPNETNGPARTTRPETPGLSTPSAAGQAIHASSADIPELGATKEIATSVNPGEQSVTSSAPAGKAEPVAAASTDIAFAVPPAPAGPPPVSVPPQLLKATPNETNGPARTAGPEVVAPVLPTPFADGKAIDASPADTSKANAINGIAPIAIPGGQGTRSTSAPVASPSKATADTKLPTREGGHGTIETKSTTISAIQEQRKSVADDPPFAVVPPAPLSQGEIKPQAPPKAPTSESTASKSEAAVASPSSETSRKDGDADGNAASSSSNGDSSKSVGVPMNKPDVSNATPETSSITAGNGTAVVPVSQPGIEGKAAAVASGASSQATDPAAKGLGQSQGGPDAEATADIAASHIFSSLQAAKLVEKAGQTELRVGIPAGELGNVDIRTSMGRNQFTAEISVERAELGRALTAELPALHDRLAEQRVPPANIILQERSSGNGAGDLRQGPRHNPYSQSMNLPGIGDAEAAPLMAIEAMEDSRGLDIHI